MAASGDNIETEIRVKSTQLIENLNELREHFFSEDDVQKNNAAQKSVQTLVEGYHQFLQSLQPAQSASSDKFKLAVDTLEQTIDRLLLQNEQRYGGFTFSILSAMIQGAEQQLNQKLLSTALKQKVSEILISKLETYNGYFFRAEIDPEMYNRVRDWLTAALQNYYWGYYEEQDFAPTVNLFRALDEDKKRNFCTMVYYTDQQWDLPDDTPSLSAALIGAGIITLQEIKESLEAFSQPSDHSDDEKNHGNGCCGTAPAIVSDPELSGTNFLPSDEEEEGKEHQQSPTDTGPSDSGGTAPEIGYLGAWIENMSPQAQLGAAFCMFAMGALGVAAGVLLALVLVNSVIPFLGITAPIAIVGCGAAVAGIVAGVTLMVGSIKMAQNAFALFASSDGVEKPSTQNRDCFRHFFSI